MYYSTRKQHKKLFGLTFFEVLLLIILIALFFSLSRTTHANKQTEQKIQITLTEMQHLKEATLAYYLENQKWPEHFKQLFGNYLNKNQQCSPWIAPSAINNCLDREAYQGKDNGDYYVLSITVPNKKIAKRIKAQLPQARIQNHTTVEYTSAAPGNLFGFLTGGGIINTAPDLSEQQVNDATFEMPSCPPGYIGHFIAAPQYQVMGFGSILQLGDFDGLTYDKKQRHHYVSAFNDLHHTTNPNEFRYANYFLTFCVLANNWQVTNSLLLPESRQQGQCDENWQHYNNGEKTCSTLQPISMSSSKKEKVDIGRRP